MSVVSERQELLWYGTSSSTKESNNITVTDHRLTMRPLPPSHTNTPQTHRLGLPVRGQKIHYVGNPHVGSWVFKASNFNTGTKPKYPTWTRIILNFSIFLSQV